MAAMTDRSQKLTACSAKLQSVLVDLHYAVSAVGGGDKIPGLALEDAQFAATCQKTMTLYICIWTALVLSRSSETWSSTASGQQQLCNLKAVVKAIDDDTGLLNIERRLELDVLKQIRKDLGMPRPAASVPEPTEPTAPVAASGPVPTEPTAPVEASVPVPAEPTPLAAAVATQPMPPVSPEAAAPAASATGPAAPVSDQPTESVPAQPRIADHSEALADQLWESVRPDPSPAAPADRLFERVFGADTVMAAPSEEADMPANAAAVQAELAESEAAARIVPAASSSTASGQQLPRDAADSFPETLAETLPQTLPELLPQTQAETQAALPEVAATAASGPPAAPAKPAPPDAASGLPDPKRRRCDPKPTAVKSGVPVTPPGEPKEPRAKRPKLLPGQSSLTSFAVKPPPLCAEKKSPARATKAGAGAKVAKGAAASGLPGPPLQGPPPKEPSPKSLLARARKAHSKA